jgi:chromosome partitioning protein
MEKQFWSNSDIHRLFKLKVKSRQTLLNAEERGEIPKAKRVPRGNTLVRQWTLEQLPQIGERFGFLKKPEGQQVLCFYTAKGGVLKTTLAYSLARILALNNIKTLLIGLDIQCSITDIALPPIEVESLDDIANQNFGLYHHLYEKTPLKKIIKSTSLPTLSIIPETTDLNVLEKKLRVEPRREYLFKDKLIPQLQEYDVIIFDNGPSWNQLIENALTTSNTIISPIGCDIGTYQALQTNLNTLFEFQKAMKIEWDNFFLAPTLLEKTKLSQQIYGAYLNQYADKIVSTPIRRGVKGQEAILLRQSAIEHDPTSSLAQDYFELTQELWGRILCGGGAHGIE